MFEQHQQPNTEVRFAEWISEGWQLFTQQWQTWVLMILAFIGIFFAVFVPLGVVSAVLQANDSDAGGLAGIVFQLLANVLQLVLGGFLAAGAFRAAFKQLRGERISVGDLFSGKDVLGPVIGGQLLVGLMTGIGAILCVIPGLIVHGLLFFTIPLIVETSLGTFGAMGRSFETTKQNPVMFVLFAIVVTLLSALGVLACGVGILATAPLYFLATAVAYRDVFGLAGARNAMPTPQSYASPQWQQGGQPSYMPPPPQFTPPQMQQGFNPPPPQQTPQSFNPPPPRREPSEPLPPTAVIPPAAPAADEETICPHCKAKLTRTARFCNYCGKPL